MEADVPIVSESGARLSSPCRFVIFGYAHRNVLAKHLNGIDIERTTEVDELADIDTPLSPLHLRDKGLRIAKPIGERDLCYAADRSRGS
jgi:hypothetical protein